MEKNQFIGLILMFALLAVYFTWLAPEPSFIEEGKQADEIATALSDSVVVSEIPQLKSEISDSLNSAINLQKFGALAFAAEGNETEEVIETEELLITFSNKGGRIKEVALKKHKDFRGNDFKLVDANKSITSLTITHQGKAIDINDLHFAFQKRTVGDTTLVEYVLSNESFSTKHLYQIPHNGFQIGFRTESSNLHSILSSNDIAYKWNHTVNRAERTLEDSRRNANVRYYLSKEGYDELSETSEEYEEVTFSQQVKWVAFKQKFFNAAIISKKPFTSGFINQKIDFNDSTSIKQMSMRMSIPYSAYLEGLNMTYYFGTNQYDILKGVAPEFEENRDLGQGPLRIINQFLIIPIFHFLRGFIGNYGLIITIIVIIIRLLLSPLTYKSHISMAKMRVMKPELDELKEKHGGDMQKMQQEQMKLYQQVGINPISGCIPMTLQMPILFSLFYFFPYSVELRGKSFLWAKDLSTYDSILDLPFTIPFYGDHVSLFTLLMTLSTIATIWSNSQVSTSVQGPMKTVQYFMPVMMLFFLNNYASGLTFYYFVSNMVTFIQTILFRKVVDEDKIHQVLQENKKKNANKKKSKFQQRLEDAMKANQEAQRNKKKKN